MLETHAAQQTLSLLNANRVSTNPLVKLREMREVRKLTASQERSNDAQRSMKTDELLPELKMHVDPRLIQRAQVARERPDRSVRPFESEARREGAVDPAQLAAELDDGGVGRNELQAVGAVGDRVGGGGDLKDEEGVEHGGRVGEGSVEDASVAHFFVACVGWELRESSVTWKNAEARNTSPECRSALTSRGTSVPSCRASRERGGRSKSCDVLPPRGQ